MSSIIQSLESLHLTIIEVSEDQKRVGFAVKAITDALPLDLQLVTPSGCCKSSEFPIFRLIMKAIGLIEVADIDTLAEVLTVDRSDVKDFKFDWKNNPHEKDSYGPFVEYLREMLKLNAVDVSDGNGLGLGLLYASDIHTLRPKLGDLTSDLKQAALEPKLKVRISGRTDIAVFRVGGIKTCKDLEMAFEIKTHYSFSHRSKVNTALREGVLQLIGCNADNQFSSPVVIVTSLSDKHYLLYLKLGPKPAERLEYFLAVKSCTSLIALIQFAKSVLLERGCITRRFAGPPTPTSDSPVKADESQSEESENYGNVQVSHFEDNTSID
jgi:hypothetical protein